MHWVFITRFGWEAGAVHTSGLPSLVLQPKIRPQKHDSVEQPVVMVSCVYSPRLASDLEKVAESCRICGNLAAKYPTRDIFYLHRILPNKSGDILVHFQSGLKNWITFNLIYNFFLLKFIIQKIWTFCMPDSMFQWRLETWGERRVSSLWLQDVTQLTVLQMSTW